MKGKVFRIDMKGVFCSFFVFGSGCFVFNCLIGLFVDLVFLLNEFERNLEIKA